MVDLGPFKAQYSLVNEDDDEYVTYDNIDDALAKLVEFPNDHIEVTLTRDYDEWMVTGRDSDGHRKRFVVHADGVAAAAESAQRTGYVKSIDSVERQENTEFDFTCQICGDPRGH